MYKMIGADGREYGPISDEQLRQWVAEGRANAQTRVQLAGTTEWKSIAEVPEISGPAPTIPPQFQPAVAEVVPNYLIRSIFLTVCCCSPFAIPAIIYGAQVNTKLAAGDMAGAMEASRKARLWCWIGFGTAIIIQIVVGVVGLAAIQKFSLDALQKVSPQ